MQKGFEKDRKVLITVPNMFVALYWHIKYVTSRGRMGGFYKAYSINDIMALGQIISPNIRVEVFDLWLPISNIFDGILKRLRIDEKTRRRIRIAFIRLPQPSLLKHFIGIICLIAKKH